MNRGKKLYRRVRHVGGLTRVLADRRGSTLIEVIVSVLIVAIAFVPLMVGLNGALKINRNAEVQLYAENVATNLTEITKTYGTKGLKSLAEEQGTDSTKGIAKLLSGATMTSDAHGNRFTVTNITSGTDKTYQAEIEFSNWDDKQNDFSAYPDIESLSDALIVNIGEDKIEDVINYYWTYAYDTYNTELTKEQLTNNASQWIKREMKITCEQGTGEDSDKVIIKKIIYYKALNAEINGNYVFKTTSNPIPAAYECQEQQICKKSALPQSIILTYRPLRDRKGKDYKLFEDKILVDKDVSGVLHLYSFCENGTTLSNSGFSTVIEYDDTSGDSPSDRYGYSNVTFSPISCTAEAAFGSGTTGKQSHMRNIVVTVKDSDGNELFTKTTSMIEVE